jgi:hypothetical protein
VVNELADHYAVEGAKLALHLSPHFGIVERHDEEIAVYKWLATLVSHWSEDTESQPPPRREPAHKPSWHLHPAHPHTLFIGHLNVECSRCRKKAPIFAPRRARSFVSSPCRSATAALLEPELLAPSLEVQAVHEGQLRQRGLQPLTLEADPPAPPPAPPMAQGERPVRRRITGKTKAPTSPPAPRQNPLTSAAALATALFGADWRSRTHCSHRLCLVPPLIGCRVCGVYASASQRFYGLKRPCPPPPEPRTRR